MKRVTAIALACVVVYAPMLLASARSCEARGGAPVRSPQTRENLS
jgi:hypothetical protein